MEQTDSINEVKFFRLMTGEDIIAEIKKIEDLTITVIKPLKLVYALGEKSGSVAIGFVHWLFPEIVENQEFSIRHNDVLVMSTPSVNMEIYYWESLKKLEKSLSYDIGGRPREEDHIDQYDDGSEISSDDLEYMQNLMETLKKLDKRKLH